MVTRHSLGKGACGLWRPSNRAAHRNKTTAAPDRVGGTERCDTQRADASAVISEIEMADQQPPSKSATHHGCKTQQKSATLSVAAVCKWLIRLTCYSPSRGTNHFFSVEGVRYL